MVINFHNKTLNYYEKIWSKIISNYNESGEKDYNIYITMFFNPYYSLLDHYNLLIGTEQQIVKYMDFLSTPEFDYFLLLNLTVLSIPYYNILGDRDYQTNHIQAEDYFNKVKVSRKKLYNMKNMPRGLLNSCSVNSLI
eukprot:jgi/Orpsp1_1/1189287/evm.model.d7180000070891.1